MFRPSRQALPPEDLDVEAAVLVGLHRGHLHDAADPVHRVHAVLADLVALPDRHDAEQPQRLVGDREQVVDQRAVAVLEHVQRQADPGNITVFNGKIGSCSRTPAYRREAGLSGVNGPEPLESHLDWGA